VAITRKAGRGAITNLGALFDPAMMQAAAGAMTGDVGARSRVLVVPAGVDVCRRVGQGREALVLGNFA
jgi:beta-galactosidase